MRRAPTLAAIAAMAAIAVVALAACRSDRPAATPVMVFAAVSLSESLAEIGEAWSQAGGAPLVFNFGASSDLARQLAAGAAADLFISADERQIERLAEVGLLRQGETRPIAGNRLVVIARRRGTALQMVAPADLLHVERLALADPEAVPAGVYAREWLQREGLWDTVRPRVVPTLDARATVTAVAAGAAAAGVVYATDAAAKAEVEVIFEVPLSRAPRIQYFVAALARSPHPEAKNFAEFLSAAAATAVFARRGFLLTAPLEAR